MKESFDPANDAEFDRHAQTYDSMHRSSIQASGEDPSYFAEYKHQFLKRLLQNRNPGPVLDFGCGIGNLTERLARSFDTVWGYDPSAQSVDLARTRVGNAKFTHDRNGLPETPFAAVVLANVLHHVPPSDREELLGFVSSKLAPNGLLIVFEHNPLNPLTRHAVATCAFDVGVKLLYPWEVRRRLKQSGLLDVSLDYIVFFPHSLAPLRPAEPKLAWCPLGAQVCAWARKGE